MSINLAIINEIGYLFLRLLGRLAFSFCSLSLEKYPRMTQVKHTYTRLRITKFIDTDETSTHPMQQKVSGLAARLILPVILSLRSRKRHLDGPILPNIVSSGLLSIMGARWLVRRLQILYVLCVCPSSSLEDIG